MSPAKAMSRDETIAALGEPFPDDAIKTRALTKGGATARYFSGDTVIRRLNRATGNRWDMQIKSLTTAGDLVTAHVALIIPELGSREHIGVQKVSERGGEDLVKGAITDALKKAATLFGVGLELYGDDFEDPDTLYQKSQQQPAPPRQPPHLQPRPPARQQQPNQPNPPSGPRAMSPAYTKDGRYACRPDQVTALRDLRTQLRWSIPDAAAAAVAALGGEDARLDQLDPQQMDVVLSSMRATARIREIGTELGWTAHDLASEAGKILRQPGAVDVARLHPQGQRAVLAQLEAMAGAQRAV